MLSNCCENKKDGTYRAVFFSGQLYISGPVREQGIHLGSDGQLLSGNGMIQLQGSGAEELVRYPKTLRVSDALGAAVLGIAQDGEAHMSTVDSQLMGPSGDRTKSEFT